MLAEFSAVVSSVKTALEIVKTANGLSNYNELVSAVSEINTKLMDAHVVALASLEKQMTLSGEISELKEKLRKFENWESQIERYKLHAFTTGALAYMLKSEMNDGQPPHYICTSCVDQQKKTTLQPRGRVLYCSTCDKSITIHDPPPSNITHTKNLW